MKKLCMIIFLPLIFSSVFAQDAATCSLTVRITNVTAQSGTIYVAIYDSDAGFKNQSPAETLTLVPDGDSHSFTVQLKPGEYAISMYHDVNADGKLNTNLVGIPKEPFGFSRYDGTGYPGGFKKHQFSVQGTSMEIDIPLVTLLK